MLRTTILTSAILSLMLTAACGKATDDQQKANTAVREANEKIIATNAEADKKVASAVNEADKQIAEAQASFMKRREDYRHLTTVNLVDLDRKVDVLVAKAKAASGKERIDLDASLKQIRVSRADFATDYGTLETASALTWDSIQARLDKEWTALKSLVDKA